jgi:hypothetical protein
MIALIFPLILLVGVLYVRNIITYANQELFNSLGRVEIQGQALLYIAVDCVWLFALDWRHLLRLPHLE